MNLTENNGLPTESRENVEFFWINAWHPGAIVRISSMKYIDRLEIEFATAIKDHELIDLSDELCYGHRFLVENVRWTRSDEYLTVIGATFVRWKPVED